MLKCHLPVNGTLNKSLASLKTCGITVSDLGICVTVRQVFHGFLGINIILLSIYKCLGYSPASVYLY